MFRFLNLKRLVTQVPNPRELQTPAAVPIRNFHERYNALHEEQTFQLSDGRTIGFAEYGDLHGTPLFFLHGSPGSRYDGSGFIDVANKLKVHIVCPDRPGHGLSSFHKAQRLGDYAGDIGQLARHLGFPKYHVMGGSGGGPYAVACAYGLPKDELINTAVVAGGGPPETTTIKMSGSYTAIVSGMVRHAPNLTNFVFRRILARQNISENIVDGIKRLVPPEDAAELDVPAVRAMTIASIREAYAQGPDGVIQDVRLSESPWNFRLEDIAGEVKLFYGHQDSRTPVALGRYYRDHLPNAELIEFEDAGHFTIWSKYEEQMFKKILGQD